MNPAATAEWSALGHGARDWAVLAVVAVVYMGMFLGGLPRLKLDRSGVALLGAIAVIALTGVTVEEASRAVDLPTVVLLFAFMVVSAQMRLGGFYTAVTRGVGAMPLSPRGLLAALMTGLFSAGPSMAALLEVAEVLARHFPSDVVYVGLALAVCAGSSLFLTAATAGPLLQGLVERAALTGVDERPIRLGFREYLGVGLIGFVLILGVAIGRTLWAIA